MNKEILAAIDCGTNSTRLLIGDGTETIYREMQITRLGSGVSESGRLSEDGISRVLEVLQDFRKKIEFYKVDKIRMAATSAARDASNRVEFFNAAESIIGKQPELLTGEEEGHLAFMGAVRELDPSDGPFLVLDIGGGSTEFTFGTDVPQEVHSCQIGCVRLTEEFIENDPVLPEELHACLTVTEGYIADVVREHPSVLEAKTLVGLAGTVSCVAGIEIGLPVYDRDRIHHFRLQKDSVEEVFRMLATENRKERLENPGMEEGRVDVIVGGMTILVKAMRQLDFSECLVSEADILDGLILSQITDPPI